MRGEGKKKERNEYTDACSRFCTPGAPAPRPRLLHAVSLSGRPAAALVPSRETKVQELPLSAVQRPGRKENLSRVTSTLRPNSAVVFVPFIRSNKTKSGFISTNISNKHP